MLEKPDLQEAKIVACLQDGYGLGVSRIAFLPLGADCDTAVYRAVAHDGTPFFVKLRSSAFDEMSVALPRFLSDQGITQIIAPLATRTGGLWAALDTYKLILYPYVEGCNGYEVDLSDDHWVEFGATLKRIHGAVLPPALAERIPRETFAPRWRERVRMFLAQVENDIFADPVAAQTAALMQARRGQIVDLVDRTEHLAGTLQIQPQRFVLCHSDLHAGNVLVDTSGAFYIVDWDNPILAPKERDLMYAGGGQGFRGHTAQEEEALFYRGYGRTHVAPAALAYYRYERIVEDIAAFCEQLLLTDAGGADRERSFGFLASNFRPGGVLEIAYVSDRTLQPKPDA